MILSDIEFYLIQIARDEGQSPVRSVVVRLATDQGLEGWGEAELPWRAAELAARREVLLSVLAGRSVFEIEDLLGLDALRPAPLRGALEIASWDLVGRIARQPLHRLFGGAYRLRIPLSVRLYGKSSSQVVQMARELSERGFHSQIITSSGELSWDVETVAEVREAVGRRVELRFDAVSGYDLQTARDLCLEVEARSLRFVLDPLRSNALEEIAALRRQTSVSLAVRRAIERPADVGLAPLRGGPERGGRPAIGRRTYAGAGSARRSPRPGGSMPRWAAASRWASAWRRCCSLPPPRRPSPVATSAPTCSCRTTFSASRWRSSTA